MQITISSFIAVVLLPGFIYSAAPQLTAAEASQCMPQEVINASNESFQTRRFEEAEQMFRQCLPYWQDAYPQSNSNIMAARNELGFLLTALGQLDKAETLLQDNYRIGLAASDRLQTATSALYLGILHRSRRHSARALPLLRLAHRWFEESYGTSHPSTATALGEIGIVLALEQQYALSEKTLRQAIASLEKTHSRVTYEVYLSALLMKRGAHREAEEGFVRVLETAKYASVDLQPAEALASYYLACLYRLTNRTADADAHYRRAINTYRSLARSQHPDLAAIAAEYNDFLNDSRIVRR
ncbi:MAG: tetratricopeptide repeat protein [Acidobacteria bacterium]|nr:tetratricopeptide repeat protein [Acidobacteriota bacterium]